MIGSKKSKVWNYVRAKISALLIVCLLVPNISYANPSVKQHSDGLNYQMIPEIEVDDAFIDDGMFYMPYSSLEVVEGDENNKHVFKVKRKGGDLKAEKVRLTMVDMTGKYDRDYTVKVIDKAFFSENVKNRFNSKSASEYISQSDYDEYNYSDAIIDGSILSEDIMTDEEKANFEFSEDDKNKAISDANAIFSENNIGVEIERIDAKDENEESESEESESEESESKDIDNNEVIDKPKNSETVSGFTGSEDTTNLKNESNEESETTTEEAIETTTEEEIETTEETIETTTEEEIETTTEETTETTTEEITETTTEETIETTAEETIETTTEESTETSTEEVAETTTKIVVETTNEKNVTNESTSEGDSNKSLEEPTTKSIENKEDSITEATIKSENDTDFEVSTKSDIYNVNDTEVLVENVRENVSDEIGISTDSEIVYGSEEVKFQIKKSSMSIIEGYEMATGLKDDRKRVIPERNAESFLNISQNSLEDGAYMQDGIETIEEELKSAYVVLEFNEGQTEKLIEITIINNNKYNGDRQVGFNLSSEDGSLVAGLYRSLTLIMRDDEDEEPTYISFTKSHYEPKDGYVTVEIERSGDSSSVATCMIDTEDITAKGGRDYSKVHAQVVFGMGVNKRIVKIPIVSIFIEKSATFKLKLQEAKAALIGNQDTAICTINKNDKNFEFAATSVKSRDGILGSANENIDLDNLDLSNGKLVVENNDIFGGGGDDYDMDSILLGDPLNLEQDVYDFTTKNANSDSEHYYINNGQGMHLYIENHSVAGKTATFKWGVDAKEGNGDRYGYSGIQIDWSCNKKNADITIEDYLGEGDSWHTMYDKNREKWDRKTSNFFIEGNALSLLWFNINRYDGMWRESPTINIESIKPIKRMYKILLKAADVPTLINDDGQTTTNHKYANYTITSLDGAKSDHTAVGWLGKTITVKLDNAINNPFYIKTLYIVSEDENTKLEIAKNTNTDATTISFKIDDGFVANCKDVIQRIDREGGGHNGRFYLKPELGKKDADVKIVKDKRVDVKIWNQDPRSSTTDINEYMYNVGDVLHFNATIKPEYSDMFECNGLNVYKVNPYSPEWITIRKPTDGSDYFPLDAEYSEIRVEPLLSQKGNMIIIRVKKEQVDAFDKTYGFLADARSAVNGDYIDYYVVAESEKICGNYFEFKAMCTDENNIPVWYEINKENVKYMQSSYYFLGSEEPTDNVIYLTYEKGESVEYSITGATYYEEVPIGGKTVDKYWQAAENVGILVDDLHFAYSNKDGEFSIIPSKGINGYYNKIKVVSNGTDKYISVMLNQNNLTTKKYTVYYETGERTITKKVYEVKAEDILISNTTNSHPHVIGVKSSNMAGTSFAAVYINDAVTILEATVVPKKADGSNYTYTYIDSNGEEVTENENVKRVEFVVVDMKDHSIKKVIEATRSNTDKTTWTAYYNFERGHYAEYMSGDKLYIRMVTDKKIGDGKGADIGGSGDRRDVPIFNETTYQAISTTFPFIEESEREPYIVDFMFMEDDESASANTNGSSSNGLKLSLPLIGELATLINAQGMSFRILTDGDRIRMYFGKKLNGKGNRYDGNGKPVSDTGYAVTLDNFAEGMNDMADEIRNSGTARLKTMTLGIPTWTIEPIIGVYVEFLMSYDPSAVIENQYEFTGGGGYFGGVIDLRYTFYFLVYGIPCYIGGEANISLIAEFGIGLNPNNRIKYDDPTQNFFDQLIKRSYFEFLFRATLIGTGYVGAGIAGTIGVRGGIQLNMLFIYNPFIKKKYDDVRPLGLSITGGIKIWIDAALIHIPTPIYDWPYPYNIGYFEDIQKVIPQSSNQINNSDADNVVNNSLMPKPRFGEDSLFVANDAQGENIYGGTYERESSRTLISGVYDASEPKMLKYDTDKALLVYLDDDHSRSSIDRTVLKYMTFDATLDKWSAPQKVWEGNNTADFSPDLCDCGDKILLSWVSRPNALLDDVPRKELLKNMEIYTVFFDKSEGTFGTINRMTMDSDYDYYPKASYDEESNRIHLYYLKKQNVSDINSASDMLNQVQTEVNGAQLMYMLYADPNDGMGERWLTDYYYDYEMQHIDPTDREEYMNIWRGQRFKNLSIDIGGDTPQINNPNISDYVVSSAKIFDTSEIQDEVTALKEVVSTVIDVPAKDNVIINNRINEFSNNNASKNKIYNTLAYVVEEDGNLDTRDDTEIYVKIHAATESETKTIRLTNNAVSDVSPKIIGNGEESYLFWIQNQSMIKMLSMNDLIEKSIIDDHASAEMKSGNINIITTDKIIMSDKISNIYPFIDDNNNIYIMWQQDSSDTVETTDGEIEFKQDLYVSCLVEMVDTDGEIVRSWSNPVRFTDNGKLNDLPTAVAINDKLLLVDNQYNLKSNGDLYDITNSNLVAMYFGKKSSVDVKSVSVNVNSKNTDGSIRYQTLIRINNTGLYAANGFDYNGTIVYDGQVLATVTGGSSEQILPGGETVIGDHTIVGGESTSTPKIYFTLTEEQQHHLDKIKLNLNIKERGIGDSGINVSRDVFNTNEMFAFSVEDKDTNNLYNGNLKVKQTGDEFSLHGILINVGNIDAVGNEKIYVIDQDDWNHPITTSEYIDLPLGGQMQFSIPISKDVLAKTKNGIKDLVVYVKNDEGKILSQYEIATVNAEKPYDFKVNGVTDKIEVKVGEKLKLNTTFEPSERYKSATILYLTEDGNIARTENDSIYGVSEGTTKLKLTTKEFGGSMTIDVNVVAKPNPPSPDYPSGGNSGSSGSGGGGGQGPFVYRANISKVDALITNMTTIDLQSAMWVYDPINNSWKLNVNVDGVGNVEVKNAFYTIKQNRITIIAGNEIVTEVRDIYYFDAEGKMLTGWVGTSDGKWYFFEDAKTLNEGKMVFGWRNVQGDWYYFTSDGSMLVDGMTPDGYKVDSEGRLVATN